MLQHQYRGIDMLRNAAILQGQSVIDAQRNEDLCRNLQVVHKLCFNGTCQCASANHLIYGV